MPGTYLPAAEGVASDLVKAQQRLRDSARRQVTEESWHRRRDTAGLEVFLETAARGLELEFSQVPAAGSAVDLRLDGSGVGTFVVQPQRPLSVALPVPAGLHLLEVKTVGGGSVLPGALRWW